MWGKIVVCMDDRSSSCNWGLRTIVVFERAPHAGLSTLISANEQLMPVNAACFKHAKGYGRQYCVLKHAAECKHSFWGLS